MKYAFIAAEKAVFPVSALCRVLAVSRSGFYGWLGRKPSKRRAQDAQLGERVEQIHNSSRKTYGSPRVHDALKDEGISTSRKRVARLMRERDLAAQQPKRFRVTTNSRHALPIAANLLQRNFRAAAPDRVWAADISYVWTWEGWMYLAVVIDLFSRRVVGWALADHMRTDLAISALQLALGRRRPGAGLIHHSDRGSQYASAQYQQLLAQHDIVSSMSRKGDCWDNAVVESFFGTIKTELVDRFSWPTRNDVRADIAEYIELFYNPVRKHSYLGYKSPLQFEKNHQLRPAFAA